MKIKNKINKPHGQLEWLPTWEGVLMYDLEDINNDRAIRVWHVHFVAPLCKTKVCEELKPILDKNKGKNEEKKPRVFFYFRFGKRKYHISRSVLTHLAYTGFDIVDRRHWVIDHINNISVDDRPSNLQCISQKENSRRSKLRKENNKLNNKERDRREKIRLEWLKQLRLELVNSMPYADPIDIEMEAQRAYEAHDFTEDYKKKGASMCTMCKKEKRLEEKRRLDIRVAWVRKRREALINVMPNADPNDIEIELAMQVEEHDFTEDYKKKGGRHVEK